MRRQLTLPPLAGVGMTEPQAVRSGKRFHINRGTSTGWTSSRRIGQKHAFYKVLVEEGNGGILGAHLFGHNAAEAINIFALAMKFGLTTRDLKKVLWAYPTHISDIKYMLD
jgi:glutathione reductase (NADPH)